ncbi:RNI-like protein [Patellaria atrata CBS 101060]|uniref:RNI-like protein n=1 Tax=Patellaria atrata CBS 101060 TaxID=1346257 RepID=A0A9P4S7L6_9PEZI|nr:RNI-like protein [Patellaria atrata CBS 101060]
MATTKVFSLEGKGLKLDTAGDIEPHIAALKANDDVEEIHFLGNTLGIGACEALAEVLKTKKKLRHANFADIFTARLLSEIPLALQALVDALVTLPDLNTVNLSDNAFGLNTSAPLVSFLSQHVPLQHLILNNNGLGPEAGTLVADALVSLAAKKIAAGPNTPKLETVICGRNRLENGSMKAWARAYAAHNGVKEIKMVQNGIRQEGITHLLQEGLNHAKDIQVLDLQDNTFTATGARALADVVPTWPKLKELGVGDCLLGARGGVMLGNALEKGENPELEVLRLQYNDIDIKGVKGIAAGLSKVPKLRRVELNGNKFSEEDDAVDKIRDTLVERRDDAGISAEDGEETWGLDELDELDDESDDEDKEEEDEKETVLKRADEAEDEKVAQKQDKGVDELANLLGKTYLLRRAAFKVISSQPQSFLPKTRSITTVTKQTFHQRQQWAVSPLQRRFASEDAAREEAKLSEDQVGDETVPSEESSKNHATVDSLINSARQTASEAADAISATSQGVAESARNAGAATSFSRSQSTAPSIVQPSDCTLYVGNLFFEVTADTLKREFGQFGPIKYTKIIYDPRGLSKGFGYVEFENKEDAAKALERLNQQIFEGRRMTVQYHKRSERSETRGVPKYERKPTEPSKTLFIGNMSFEMSDKDLNDLFREIRNVLDVRVAIDRRTGQPRGFAHADFIDVASAERAKELLNDKEIYGRRLRVDFGKRSAREPGTDGAPQQDTGSTPQ